MAFTDYLLVLFAAVGLTGLGRLLLPGSGPGRQFMAGLAVVAALAATMVWHAPLAVIPFCRAAILVGFTVLLLQARRGGLVAPGRPDARGLGALLAGAGVGVALSYPHHIDFIQGLAGQEYIFGPFVEIFLADYFGPLRIPTYYPWEMRANHILAATTLAPLGAWLPAATAVHAVQIKFLLMSFAVARLTHAALRAAAAPLLPFIAVVAGGFLVFNIEFYGAIGVTTYVYCILAIEVGIAIFLDRQEPELRARDCLFLLAAMAASKGSIVYLPALVFLWVAARFPRQVLNPAVVVGAFATIAQFAVVLQRPRPFPDAQIGFTLANPLGGRAGFDYYPPLRDVFVNGWTLGFFKSEYSVGVVAVLAMAAVKYWFLPIRAIDSLARDRTGEAELLRVSQVFLLTVLAGLVLVRHDQHGTTHQGWLIVGSAPVVLAAFLARAGKADGGRWRLGLVAAGLAAFAFGQAGETMPWHRVRTAQTFLGGVPPAELRAMSPSEVLAPREGDAVTDICDRALLRGLRVPADTVPFGCMGGLSVMAVEPDR